MTTPALHIVTGKGGVGKTTTALALATRLALGGRVLVCETEARGALADALGRPPLVKGRETQLEGNLWGLAVDARDSLTDYLARNFRLGAATALLDRAGLVDFATTIAPGLRDVLLVGKVYEAARRPDAFRAVVLDAPPTGRVASFLAAGDALMEVSRLGPIHAQADRIMTWLRSEAVVVHLVTTLAEMPVTETVAAIGDLRARRLPLGALVVNRAAPTPPEGDLDPADPDHDALAAVLADARERAARQAGFLPHLAALGLPMVDLPEVPDVESDRSALVAALGAIS